jgi:hypothetical protein
MTRHTSLSLLLSALVACASDPELTGPGEAPTPIMSAGGEASREAPPQRAITPAQNLEERLEVPATPARFFGLRARTEPGLVGRIVLNDTELGTFGIEGYQLASNQAQCELRAGANRLVVEVRQVASDATAPEGQALVEVSLHGMTTEAGFPSEDNRFFRIEWNPEGPAARHSVFTLSAEQSPAHTAACGTDPEAAEAP